MNFSENSKKVILREFSFNKKIIAVKNNRDFAISELKWLIEEEKRKWFDES